jgi:nucleotide-binding universal stress UspA family protein
MHTQVCCREGLPLFAKTELSALLRGRRERRMTTVEPSAREPLKNVFVATDFSSGSELALGRALALSRAPGARLHVVHVLPADLAAKVRSKAEAEARARLGQALSRARDTANALGELNLTSEVLRGQAFVEIIRCSRSIDADLLVLGRHGRRPVRDMFMGTTAERVIRKGDVPVLVVNLDPTQPYRRPLIAVDPGDASRRTLQLALRVLGPEVKSINVVHAFNVPFEGFVTPTFSAREKSDYRRSFREKAATDLASFLASFPDIGVRWKTAVRRGDARSVILGEGLRRRADLIALGTHARSGVAHALLGSVAEWIIAAASCDVLVARPIRFSFELP